MKSESSEISSSEISSSDISSSEISSSDISSSDINIVEAYIKFNKKLIILISGLSGSGRSDLAKNISRDFKIKIIKLINYYKDPSHLEDIDTPSGKIKNYYKLDAYDWDKFNKDVIKEQHIGVIIYGDIFPTDNLKFEPDFHIHIKINKQNLQKRREDFNKKHDIKQKDADFENTMIKKYILPFYFENLSKQKIDKFINANEIVDSSEYHNKIYDDGFDYLINKIQNYTNKLVNYIK